MLFRYTIQDRKTKVGWLSELIIANVDRDDTSEFGCTAGNIYGNDETTIHLIVQGRIFKSHFFTTIIFFFNLVTLHLKLMDTDEFHTCLSQ